MIQLFQEDLPFFRFRSFPADGRICHAVFTRKGGISPPPFDSLNLSVSVADDRDNVFANRRQAYGSQGRENNTLVHAYLTHGAEIALVSEKEFGQYVGPVDGLITDRPGCGLTMNYADCAPVLLFDPVHQAIGLGHAGWQGVVKDLPGTLVQAMQQAFGSDPSRLMAGIGPCIGPCCYQVGQVVISAVSEAFDDPGALLLPAGNSGQPMVEDHRRIFDLPKANEARLAAAGVKQIEQAGLCTACRTDLFFSHRAEKGRTGRFGALLILGQAD